MYGFNVTDKTFPYDNRPVAPLMDMPFNQWWFHGHLDYPPNPGDTFDLPAGKVATAEIACHKGATSYFASIDGGDIRQGDSPCPNSPPSAIHTTGRDGVKGCALAIAYKSDARDVQPEDFAVFSVNHVCVWNRFTDFPVPQRMPPCPEGGCICAWFWIHSVRHFSLAPHFERVFMDFSRTAGACRVRFLPNIQLAIALISLPSLRLYDRFQVPSDWIHRYRTCCPTSAASSLRSRP